MPKEEENKHVLSYEDESIHSEEIEGRVNIQSLIFKHLWLITRCIMNNPDKLYDAVSTLEITLSPYLHDKEEYYKEELKKINGDVGKKLEEKNKRREKASKLNDQEEADRLMNDIKELKIEYGKKMAKLLVNIASRKGFYPQEIVSYDEV